MNIKTYNYSNVEDLQSLLDLKFSDSSHVAVS